MSQQKMPWKLSSWKLALKLGYPTIEQYIKMTSYLLYTRDYKQISFLCSAMNTGTKMTKKFNNANN